MRILNRLEGEIGKCAPDRHKNSRKRNEEKGRWGRSREARGELCRSWGKLRAGCICFNFIRALGVYPLDSCFCTHPSQTPLKYSDNPTLCAPSTQWVSYSHISWYGQNPGWHRLWGTLAGLQWILVMRQYADCRVLWDHCLGWWLGLEEVDYWRKWHRPWGVHGTHIIHTGARLAGMLSDSDHIEGGQIMFHQNLFQMSLSCKWPGEQKMSSRRAKEKPTRPKTR